MEIIRGKQTSILDSRALHERLPGYTAVHLDLGTGDGRFVQTTAQRAPQTLVIGVDACRANLHEVTRRAPANALFVIANAQALPAALDGLATHISIHFPWGSLLTGLLNPEDTLLAGLGRVACSHVALTIYLNGGALGEAGWSLTTGAQQVQAALAQHGFRLRSTTQLAAAELRRYPTTWAKRLAFGRDPRAVCIQAIKIS